VRTARPFGWAAACALVVLASRSLSYAVAPHPDIVAGHLEARLGGPRLVVVVVVSFALAVGLAGAALWIAATAVRERRDLSPAPVVGLARIEPRRVLVRAILLALASSAAFAMLESYLHFRAGLGLHGVTCLAGPVHRDALPFLVSLSLLAASLLAALEHLLAWMRRTLAALLSPPSRPHGRAPAARRARGSFTLRPRLLPLGASPRGPPRDLVAIS
jgi:hypothetical protein